MTKKEIKFMKKAGPGGKTFSTYFHSIFMLMHMVICRNKKKT